MDTPDLVLPVERVRALLEGQVEHGKKWQSLLTARISLAKFSETDVAKDAEYAQKVNSWRTRNFEILRRAFTETTYADQAWRSGQPPAPRIPTAITPQIMVTPTMALQQLHGQVSKTLVVVEDVLHNLDLFETTALGPVAEIGHRIFLIHGHNDHLKTAVARFLEQSTGREVMILHEQASGGKTLIGKLERYAADIAFAVVLATPDDEGRNVVASGPSDWREMAPSDWEEVGEGERAVSESFERRARQNVIFEMGYFFGLLGRSRVPVLLAPGLEAPSDVDGLVYISLESDWRIQLARELKGAGIECDPTKGG